MNSTRDDLRMLGLPASDSHLGVGRCRLVNHVQLVCLRAESPLTPLSLNTI